MPLHDPAVPARHRSACVRRQMKDHRIAAERGLQVGPLQRLGVIADQDQADRRAMTLDDGIGGQGRGHGDQGNIPRQRPLGQMRQHPFDRPFEADRQVMLGGERLRRSDDPGRRVEEDGIGIGAAGIQAEQGSARFSLVYGSGAIWPDLCHPAPRGQAAGRKSHTSPPNPLQGSHLNPCQAQIHFA